MNTKDTLIGPFLAVPRMTIGELLNLARGLKSEDGENPEYDRALVELVCFIVFREIGPHRAGVKEALEIQSPDGDDEKMDPDAVYQAFLEAIVERDCGAAEEYLAALQTWIGNGGFIPRVPVPEGEGKRARWWSPRAGSEFTREDFLVHLLEIHEGI